MIDLFKSIPFFAEPNFRNELQANGQLQTLEKGDVIVREGQFLKFLPIVIEGSIRVFQTKEDREILLYYVEPGQTCMMSLSACFFNNESPSQAVALEKTTILSIPARFIIPWQKEYACWNEFIIRTFRMRYDELLSSFESVAFNSIEKRILEYLHRAATTQQNKEIDISHQALANELGTTRVVVSRILKQLESEGRLVLHYGTIRLL